MEVCNFEIAVKLKEKGYPQIYYGRYSMTGACYFNDGRFYEDGCIANVEDCCTAPTISQVLKWLRDEKKLYLSIEPHLIDFSSTKIMWIWDALYINSDCKFQWHDGEFGFDSYEKAAVSAIEYVIDNLI